MKFLVTGLGSMGKRRIRNLLALGHREITGFDLREDRRREVSREYKIPTVAELSPEILAPQDALIISTPPDYHLEYLKLAVAHRKPAFVEASVLIEGLAEVNRQAKAGGILIAPSCTFRFHPTIKRLKELVQGGRYGKLCNYVYYMGQYLPDWHPWEDIRDYYVSRKETSACREMVPFELTWLNDIAGYPLAVTSFYGKTLDFGVDIDDTYSISLRYPGFIGTLVIDVVSRFPSRSLFLNLEKAHIRWNWEEKQLRLYEAETRQWHIFEEPSGKAHRGYCQNIIEEMYVEELAAFIKAVQGEAPFPNRLEDDMAVLRILAAVEKNNTGIPIEGQSA